MASGKHRAPSESEGRCFMQTALRRKTETGNEKDPSAALGMTKRGNASFHSFSTCCGSQPASLRSAAPSKGRGSRGHSLLPMEKAAIRGCRYPRHKAFFFGCQYPFFLSTSFMSLSPWAKATKFIWRRLVSLSQKSGTMEAMCGVMMTLSICQKG